MIGAKILTLLHQLLLVPALLVVSVMAATAAAWVALLAQRGEPARLGRRELGTLARETSARLIFGLPGLLPWGHGSPVERRPQSPPQSDPSDPSDQLDRWPVLLVPGPPQKRNALFPLATYLRNRGYPWVWAVGPGKGNLAARAEQLAVQVETLRRTSGEPQVAIVAHGLGGLTAAWYIAHLGGDKAVAKLVTLGTPWRGTRMAVFTSGPLGRESLPDAPVLDGLAPCAAPTVSIWGSLDPMVLPHSSARAKGSVSVEIEGAGHLDLLISARAWRATLAALGHHGEPP